MATLATIETKREAFQDAYDADATSADTKTKADDFEAEIRAYSEDMLK